MTDTNVRTDDKEIAALQERLEAAERLNGELLTRLKRIAWQGEYKPTDEEMDGEDGDHYHQILGRWDAGEEARALLTRLDQEANQ